MNIYLANLDLWSRVYFGDVHRVYIKDVCCVYIITPWFCEKIVRTGNCHSRNLLEVCLKN